MQNGENGNISLFIGLLLGIFSFFINNIDIILKASVAIASIAAASMALRYHYYATKERKQQIELNSQQEKRNFTQEKNNLKQEKNNFEQEQKNIEHEKIV